MPLMFSSLRPISFVAGITAAVCIGCDKKPPAPMPQANAPATAPSVVAPVELKAVTVPAVAVVDAKFDPTTAPSTQSFPRVAKEEVLHNAHRLTDKLISGAQPEGDKSFQALRDLGVKTIISVDGAKPDVELARKYGMRYVHLPITYSTVTEEQGRQIGKALRELDGPVYLHCHHGKHRSAAAVAVACVNNGMLKPEQAESVLKTFGTGENYKGLWRAARDARPVDEKMLAETKVTYVEQAAIPLLADAMVSVDESWDRLRLIQKAGWKVPAAHPALDPPHEALQLQELLHELGRSRSVQKQYPPDFLKLLADNESAVAALREALSAKPVDTTAADAAFQRAASSCVSCHKAHRD